MITRTYHAHEKPILFSGPMVRAILDGKKTMTRRIIKPQPSKEWHRGIGVSENRNGELCLSNSHGIFVSDLKCPYCKQIGDRLWVRENFSFLKTLDKASPGPDSILPGASILYTATGENNGKQIFQNIPNLIFGRVRPSIHMPRWASRITLEITGVSIERLQDITEEDARAEGVGSVEEFKDLWKKINGTESWKLNPWVWVVKFEAKEVRE